MYTTWTSSTCNCTQNGADINGVSWKKGDSGSPVWSSSDALGLAVTLGGKMPRMTDIATALGVDIYD